MSRLYSLRFALALLAGCALSAAFGPASSQAQSASPLHATVRLGPGGAAQRIAVERAADGALVLVVGKLREPLALVEAVGLNAEAVELAPGRFAAVVRVRGPGSSETGVVLDRAAGGGARVLFNSPLDPRGDRGERHWSSIEVRPAAPGGQTAQVVVADYADRVRVCGESATPLRTRRLDSAKGDWVTMAVPLLAPGRVVESVAAVPQLDAVQGPPLVAALREQGVSSTRGANAAGYDASRKLTDGNASSAWIAATGVGEVVTFAVESGGLPLQAIALTAAVAPEGTPLARSLLLVGDEGPVLRVQLPDAPTAGARYWVPLSAERTLRCLAIVADADASSTASALPLGLAEIEAYTRLDFAGGLDALLGELSREGSEGARAVDLLVRVGPAAAPALAARWPQLTLTGRARAVRALAAHAKTSEPARAALDVALSDADAEVRRRAIEALLAANAEGRTLLAKHVTTANAVGDDVAGELAAAAPADAMGVILPAIEAAGDTRPALRAALTVACDRGGAAALDALRAWAKRDGLSVTARATVAQALAKCRANDDVRALTTELVAAAIAAAERFEDRWRLVVTSERAGASAPIDAFSVNVARADEHWMLREAALRALATRDETQARALASTALRDDYPRVRVVAAQVLAKEPSAHEALSAHARRDHWPMVRAAALEALALQAGSVAVLEDGVKDRVKSVRAAAIRGLTAARARGAWKSSVEPRLRDIDEWPEVVTAAIEYSRELCVSEAAPLLLDRLRRGIAPNAHHVDAELTAPAFEALIALGGEPAKEALALANSAGAPAGLKALGKHRMSSLAGCSPAR